jgi:NAD(P)-dependent dehydrogenase (short-subunit alcohol dehydrogenase family)
LINNAGNAHGLDFIHEGKIEDWDMMIDTNVKGLLYVSKPILDIMTKNNLDILLILDRLQVKNYILKVIFTVPPNLLLMLSPRV